MLNIDDPRSTYIIRAAHIQDDMQMQLWQLAEATPEEARALRDRVLGDHIERLRELNEAHFNARQDIAETINALARALESAPLDELWERFHDLANSPRKANFGTWAM